MLLVFAFSPIAVAAGMGWMLPRLFRSTKAANEVFAAFGYENSKWVDLQMTSKVYCNDNKIGWSSKNATSFGIERLSHESSGEVAWLQVLASTTGIASPETPPALKASPIRFGTGHHRQQKRMKHPKSESANDEREKRQRFFQRNR